MGNGREKEKASLLTEQPSLYFSNTLVSLSQFSVDADATHLEMYRHMVKRWFINRFYCGLTT